MDSPPVSIREERGGGDLSRVKLLAERERERIEGLGQFDRFIGLYRAVRGRKTGEDQQEDEFMAREKATSPPLLSFLLFVVDE